MGEVDQLDDPVDQRVAESYERDDGPVGDTDDQLRGELRRLSTACTASNTTRTAMRTTAIRELQLEDLMLWTRALERDFAASPVVMSVLRL